MITSELKNKIDKIWQDMWASGISNPITVIEQLTYLMFIKALDDKDIAAEELSGLLGTAIPRIFPPDKQQLRWSYFSELDAARMYELMQTAVFPFIKQLGANSETAYSRYMKDAMFFIPTPLLLEKAVTGISALPLKDSDLKGDIYEYMLGKISQSGTNGQFRTPRHIINMMVEIMQPQPRDVICDPACGTAGFLVAASCYLLENHKTMLYDETLKQHFFSDMFFGFDTDQTMLRIAAMNMMLHNVEQPNIEYKDSLSALNLDRNKYTLVLANPPFTGSLDLESVGSDLRQLCKTKKTELLFLALFIKSLRVGGRCASIVPDGVLFGSSKAHKELRQELVDNHQLTAVISMPSGVFKPYAGVSTAVLVFTKTGAGGTDAVWFYDMQADGYSLDDKRNPIENNDIPDIIAKFHEQITANRRPELNDRKAKCFMVPKQEIIANGYDLSINKYKEIEHTRIEYAPPAEILAAIAQLDAEIAASLRGLELDN